MANDSENEHMRANGGRKSLHPVVLLHNLTMHVSAKVDYALRALLELAAVTERDKTRLTKAEALAQAQNIPTKFLEGILSTLRNSGFLVSQRGADGGYRLAMEPKDIHVADVMRALDGPIAAVRGERPEDLEYSGTAEHLREVWVATRAALRSVLEVVTLADIQHGKLPKAVNKLLDAPGAWERR
jgi:Rrf2 family protein